MHLSLKRLLIKPLYGYLLILLLSVQFVHANNNESIKTVKAQALIFNRDTVFWVKNSIGAFTPAQRVNEIEKKLNLILKRRLNPDLITVKLNGPFADIVLDDIIIMSISDNDITIPDTTRIGTANTFANSIKNAIEKNLKAFSTENILFATAVVAGVFLFSIIVLLILKKISNVLLNKFKNTDLILKSKLKIKHFVLLDGEQIMFLIIQIVKIVYLAAVLVTTYYVLTYSANKLPWFSGLQIESLTSGVLKSIFIIQIGYVLIKFLRSFFETSIRKIEIWKATFNKSDILKKYEIISVEQIATLLVTAVRTIKTIFYFITLYFMLTTIFSFFTFSSGWAALLVGYLLNPLYHGFDAFVGYIPNLMMIFVIFLVSKYALKLIKLFFDGVESERIQLANFPADWGSPTYKIIRTLLIIFALTLVFPLLPGSESPVFRGVSVVIGLLFSFGSSSAVSNIMGGLVLTYTRSFNVGDRVKIADTVGDIVEKTLLVTRIKTVKNVIISIPNSIVLNNHIINYSSISNSHGLILNTTVTIGYDAPWRKVHELLISAALSTQNILSDPAPFVLQTSLNDFYVSYEINAYTGEPTKMALIYSDLHSNIQEKFNEAGVEIMSAHYSNLRDGNQTTIPQNYLNKDYVPPTFKVTTKQNQKD